MLLVPVPDVSPQGKLLVLSPKPGAEEHGKNIFVLGKIGYQVFKTSLAA